MKSITIRKPDDWHIHLRQGDLLPGLLSQTAQYFARGLVMPNTVPPVLTGGDARRYLDEIMAANRWGFEPLMSLKLTSAATPRVIKAASAAGVVAGKLYPAGVTTNSADGVRNFDELWPVFEAMQDVGMVLCLHGEMPGGFVLDREREFLPVLESIAADFPRLRIVLEHVSTAAAVERVAALPDTVAATITVHHLVLTLDDVIGGGLQPHHFCQPIPKTPADRQTLIQAATSGNPKFFFGSDSAPHLRASKESANVPAGIFTAPVALPILAELFDAHDALNQLESFTSVYGAQFYGLPLNQQQITLVRDPWVVPDDYAGVVPLRAGQELAWRVAS